MLKLSLVMWFILSDEAKLIRRYLKTINGKVQYNFTNTRVSKFPSEFSRVEPCKVSV